MFCLQREAQQPLFTVTFLHFSHLSPCRSQKSGWAVPRAHCRLQQRRGSSMLAVPGSRLASSGCLRQTTHSLSWKKKWETDCSIVLLLLNVLALAYFIKHRIIGSLNIWVATFKGHPVQLPCNEQGHLQQIRLLRTPSTLTLSVSTDRASTTSLGSLKA